MGPESRGGGLRKRTAILQHNPAAVPVCDRDLANCRLERLRTKYSKWGQSIETLAYFWDSTPIRRRKDIFPDQLADDRVVEQPQIDSVREDAFLGRRVFRAKLGCWPVEWKRASARTGSPNLSSAAFPLSWARYRDKRHRGPERMQEEIPWEH